jgi:hypothetical protein
VASEQHGGGEGVGKQPGHRAALNCAVTVISLMGESGPMGRARPPFDGLIRGRLTLVFGAVGQFRTAGGLVLLSGRTLGPQMFLPLISPQY